MDWFQWLVEQMHKNLGGRWMGRRLMSLATPGLAAHATKKLPAACVNRSRWHQTDPRFSLYSRGLPSLSVNRSHPLSAPRRALRAFSAATAVDTPLP